MGFSFKPSLTKTPSGRYPKEPFDKLMGKDNDSNKGNKSNYEELLELHLALTRVVKIMAGEAQGTLPANHITTSGKFLDELGAIGFPAAYLVSQSGEVITGKSLVKVSLGFNTPGKLWLLDTLELTQTPKLDANLYGKIQLVGEVLDSNLFYLNLEVEIPLYV